MSEERSRAAYSVVAQIGHDSVAVAPLPPFPPPPSTLPFSKNRAGKVLDQSERVRAADSLSQPSTRLGNFSIFSTQIFGLNILEGGGGEFCATELFTGFLCPTTTVHSECVWKQEKIWAEIFTSNGAATATADLAQ